ncbi:unnamed protein product [Rotaria sp. Silwood1]|nr:unnamed protein product [Rotaria sp. Silwood1]CAF4937840.1 unnamed protein product [Rotaria sp. Silwood1]
MLQPVARIWNPTDFEADIILVHGLGGDSRTTWTNSAGDWPINWLLDSQVGIRGMLTQYGIQDLPQANKIRVLTVSHRSDMFNSDADSDPYNIATQLIRHLFHAGVGSKPIVWITHSLGGLIIKEILLFASKNEIRIDMFNSTKGVVFFGTPHCGATWASVLRHSAPSMHQSLGLRYLDPSPDTGEGAGNRLRLDTLNTFFARNNIPFLNFSEGMVWPQLANRFNITVVTEAQAYITGAIVANSRELGEQMALGILPPRVHIHCSDRNHLNIARPPSQNHSTYRLTRAYVANWLQRRAVTEQFDEHNNWDDFCRKIVGTVRIYALAINTIVADDTVRTLISIAGATSFAVGLMNIKEFLLVMALLSGALIISAAGVVVAGGTLAGPFGVAAAGFALASAGVTAMIYIRRLSPNVEQLLRSNQGGKNGILES